MDPQGLDAPELIRPAILGARVVVCDSEATRADVRAWLNLHPAGSP